MYMSVYVCMSMSVLEYVCVYVFVYGWRYMQRYVCVCERLKVHAVSYHKEER